jgi:uncharacterized protein YggU (UPF0235/DUF167 family)
MPALLKVRVAPRSKCERVVRDEEGWKVYVTSPPVEGRANKAVCEAIARALHLPKSAVSIRAGQTSRIKVLAIDELDEAEIERRLAGDFRDD